MKTLILLRGLPGAGKSTLAKILGFKQNHNWVEADMYFTALDGTYHWKSDEAHIAHNWCRNQVEVMMTREIEKICVSNTFTRESELKAYYTLAEKHGYNVVSLIVENRHDGVNQHDVPEATLEKMKNRFTIQL